MGATMFGVTTPCVTAAREELERLGYEPVVFHATGVGGQAMEGLMESGFLQAACSTRPRPSCATTSSAACCRPGPTGSRWPAGSGIPQVVSVGALDMVNFGARDTVPAQFEDRNLYVHNPSVTLMRTTKEENAELGRRIARKLSAATGPTALFVPLGGVSMIDAEGQPFHDPEADAALFEELRKVGDGVELDRARHEHQRPRVRPRDGAQARRVHHCGGRPSMTGDEARAKLRATIDSGGVIIGAGAGTGPVRQVRRGRRHGPDHHLQLGPLPDGGPRLAGRPDALWRRQRDRHGDGGGGAAGGRATRPCWPASAARTPSG